MSDLVRTAQIVGFLTHMLILQSQLPHKHADTFDATDTDINDAESVTLTVQTGVSSNLRSMMGSRISRHSVKIKSSSSFPNLLSLYHSPIREEVIVEVFSIPRLFFSCKN